MRLNSLGFVLATVVSFSAFAGDNISEGAVLYANVLEGAAQISEMATDAIAERSALSWFEGRRNGGELAFLSLNRFSRGKSDTINTYSGALVADIERNTHHFGVVYGYGRSNAKLRGEYDATTSRTSHYLLKVFGEEDFELFVAKASAEVMRTASKTSFADEGRIKSHRYGIDFGLESRMRAGSFSWMPYVGARFWAEDPRDTDRTRVDRQRILEFPVGMRFGVTHRFEESSLEALLDLRYVRATGDTDTVAYRDGLRRTYEAFAANRGMARLALRAQFQHANVGLRYGYTHAGDSRKAHDAVIEFGYRF